MKMPKQSKRNYKPYHPTHKDSDKMNKGGPHSKHNTVTVTVTCNGGPNE